MSTLMSMSLFLILTIGLMAVAYIKGRHELQSLSLFGQGVGGIVTTLALVAAAVIFFQESRDRAHLSTDLATRALKVTFDAKPAVLFQISANIHNIGSRPAKVRCTNLDVAGIPKDFHSDDRYSDYEFNLTSLINRVDRNKYWTICWNRKIEQQKDPYLSTSGYIWPDTDIDPGSVDTLYYEIIVPCVYSSIRTVVKVRKLFGIRFHEYRLISPISDICSGKITSSFSSTAKMNEF